MSLDNCSPHPHSHNPPDKVPDGEQKDVDWTIITFMVVIALACVMLISAAFIYYQCIRRHDHRLRTAERHHRRRRRESSRTPEDFLNSPTQGLGGAMIDSLPVFVYTPENYKDGLRCAVCLCEFQHSEKGRLLPSCNHSFHVDCIGMWFYSHSTCPLCRTKVEKQSDASVELDLTQMEVSLREEKEEEEMEEKEVVGSSSGSPEAEQHGNNGGHGVRFKDDGVGDHVCIDLDHQRN
ncbi:hypothetical protein SUGI_0786370 [Cryptomeria japonica]|uniref:RING-H2 finger protein ATL2 n=1 Tax=Cryptomeria japonica TaxID=3369 RepID=UPI002414826B|nr:RING-H2 finger protein ATL2 [Cryptomeria japonica]GLJ38569.1 hypothetical protein SUGI_0786370 [Cryptomeria japonica]